ncbi:MAG: hypothetical protein GX270_14630 [Clostridiaceae bacterium]|jgi:hypothetical protein|nr:hypothetical protein [Clostridiaceae bacterium]
MNYRRVPRSYRYPYIKPESSAVQDNTNSLENTVNEIEKTEIESIPMPNETPKSAKTEYLRNQRPMFLDNIVKNIHADDIILLGLIFILIQENLEDEFLIIVLIYLLIAGRDR